MTAGHRRTPVPWYIVKPEDWNHLEELRRVCRELARATDLRAQRDELVREGLAARVPYAVLQDATGLSASQIDAIRRGTRTRRDWTPSA